MNLPSSQESRKQLALNGGTPVRPNLLPYGRQFIDDEDIESVDAVLRSSYLTTGPKVAEFEEAFAREVGARFAVAVSSGTAALHTAVIAGGIKPGDEIITTPITFVATANCVRFQGGTVVFADVEEDTLNICPESVEARITEKTRAIIPVDYAGHPCDLDRLAGIAEKHGLLLIEDSAHALGALYNDRRIGSIGQMTAFSLHPVKHITTGEGGMVTTNDELLAARVRQARNHGLTTDHLQRQKTNDWAYDVEELGLNYRLADFHCALGISQVHKLPLMLKRRREIAQAYNEAFRDFAEFEIPTVRENCDPSWHLYVIRLNLDKLTVDRDTVFKALRAENIGVNVHYIPVPWFSYYQSLGYEKGGWPVAESVFHRVLSMPIWPGMTDDDVNDVVVAVEKVMTAFRK